MFHFIKELVSLKNSEEPDNFVRKHPSIFKGSWGSVQTLTNCGS